MGIEPATFGATIPICRCRRVSPSTGRSCKSRNFLVGKVRRVPSCIVWVRVSVRVKVALFITAASWATQAGRPLISVCVCSRNLQGGVRQQAQGDVPMPGVPAAHLVLVQPHLVLCLLKALLDGPTRVCHSRHSA
jgi:hypothetical protein